MNKTKKWIPLFGTNFFGVLNNNFLRNLIAFLSLSLFTQNDKGLIVTLASGLYVMPYIFFSPLGGRLAKAYNKSNIMFYSKCTEMVIFIVACVSFAIHNIYLALSCVFLVGLISTLFSPSKYGLIRDIGGDEGISFGTGTLEMFTFLGVLIGTFLASLLSDHYSHLKFIFILLGISGFQIFLSSRLKKISESQTIEVKDETLNPLSFLVRSFKWAGTIKNSNVIVFGLAIFWMAGNFILMNLMVHCGKVLHMTNTQTGFIMNISGIGIGVGSVLTGILSHRKVQLGFTPIGAVGMLLCFGVLFVARPEGAAFATTIFLVSFFSGMYMVPLSSWVQHSVEGRRQGDMLAYSNFIIFLLTLISAALFSPIVSIFDTFTVWLVLFIIVLTVLLWLLVKVDGMGRKTLELLRIRVVEIE